MKILPQNRVTNKNHRCKTIKTFRHEMYSKNQNLIILGNYKNAHTPLKFICTICNYSWYKTPNAGLKYYNCKKCSNRYSYTPEEFKIVYENTTDNKLTLLTDYKNADTNIICKCNSCGFEFPQSPYDILNNVGCRICSAKILGFSKRKSHEEFKNQLAKIHPQFEVVGQYSTSKDRVEIKCLLCNETWFPIPSLLLKEKNYNNGCPKCIVSKGERMIMNFLNMNNISFKTQHKYNNLLGVGGRNLSYDFYLPAYNMLIEFQGIQHSQPIDEFGGEKQFKVQQEHDSRKREYALSHNINLLEIWHYEIDDINTILTNKLNLESVTTTGVV